MNVTLQTIISFSYESVLQTVDVDSGQTLGVNEKGDLWCRGPQMMKEYLNRPEATEDAIVNGWYRTGEH